MNKRNSGALRIPMLVSSGLVLLSVALLILQLLGIAPEMFSRYSSAYLQENCTGFGYYLFSSLYVVFHTAAYPMICLGAWSLVFSAVSYRKGFVFVLCAVVIFVTPFVAILGSSPKFVGLHSIHQVCSNVFLQYFSVYQFPFFFVCSLALMSIPILVSISRDGSSGS